jgi:sortase (surface protein transpeptidase)
MTTALKLARSRVPAILSAAAMLVASTGASSQAAMPAAAAPQAQPASMPFADSAFEAVWLRNDHPVASGAVSRSWTWGPAPLASGVELYTDAPDGSGMRLVQYFDKSRMEINNPKLSPSDKWFVTNGLLTVELISGQMQIGNSKFETRKPAAIPIASDGNDTNAPTYASFGAVSNTSAGDKRQPDNTGKYATGRITKPGAVSQDASKASAAQAKIVYYEKTTGHNVPVVFWDFLNTSASVRTGRVTADKLLLDPWVFAMGLPISDAYWASVKIDGKQQDVLIQAFERRVLTYAPGLPKGWQVQMGNIGQHYYQWRYSSGPGLQKQPTAKPGMPVHFTIPVLGVGASVEHVGVDKDNNMDIPKDYRDVAWFKPGTIPGNPGNAAIDGHLDWYGVKEAVFFYIGTLKAGDRVYVRDDKGRDRAFVVTKQAVCTWQNCPLKDIFGPTTGVHLNLITCNGNFNRNQQQYDKRLVVFTEAAQ